MVAYDRLRSASGLKATSTDVIISNRSSFQILRSMADFLVRVWAYVSDVIGCRFEKVRNVHRFENLKKDIDLRIWKKDIGLRYICL